VEQRSCPVCGTKFQPSNGNQKYCQRRCKKRVENAARYGWDPASRPMPAPFDCAQCGVRCVPGDSVAAHATKFCGAKCKTDWHWQHEDGANRRWAEENGAHVNIFQGPHCRIAARPKPRKLTAGYCWECSTPFVTRYHPLWPCRYCSDSCQRRAGRRATRHKTGHQSNHRKRARHFGVEYEPISKTKLFERDGYLCGICGEPTKKDEAVPHPQAPTIDHIVPMSRGGPHLYSNVQCACFECNWRKRDIVDDQLAFAA
jgi:5-methylcytosine-specific restriction endonuclease McrA